jgi:hypothetical protein
MLEECGVQANTNACCLLARWHANESDSHASIRMRFSL